MHLRLVPWTPAPAVKRLHQDIGFHFKKYISNPLGCEEDLKSMNLTYKLQQLPKSAESLK